MRTIPETTERKRRNLVPVAVGLAIAALVLSATVLGLTLTASTPAPAPQTRDIRIIISSVAPHNETMAMMMGERHVYMPSTIVVNRGDTIRLTIVNLDEHRHGFEIRALNVETDSALDIAPGDEVLLPAFTVPQPGVYVWECNVPYEPATATTDQECGEDHDEMQGFLIVQ